MAQIDEYLKAALKRRASDIHFAVKAPVYFRVDGELAATDSPAHSADQLQDLIFEILSQKERETFLENKNLDKSHFVEGVGYFRVNVFQSHHGLCAVFRAIPLEIPSFESIGLPDNFKQVLDRAKGLVLVTGPTGSGKSTSLASMIDYLNKNKARHILTIEDPIEYIHKNQKSLVTQREIGKHCHTFSEALKYAFREDPDVILVGEMRDFETISLALTAAETGHLVLGTLHTGTAVDAIDRVIDSFPEGQQAMARSILSGCLAAVVSQRLLKQSSGEGRVPAFEVMVNNSAVANLIREGKSHQLPSTIQTSKKEGMRLMDDEILRLVRENKVQEEDAKPFISNVELLPNRGKSLSMHFKTPSPHTLASQSAPPVFEPPPIPTVEAPVEQKPSVSKEATESGAGYSKQEIEILKKMIRKDPKEQVAAPSVPTADKEEAALWEAPGVSETEAPVVEVAAVQEEEEFELTQAEVSPLTSQVGAEEPLEKTHTGFDTNSLNLRAPSEQKAENTDKVELTHPGPDASPNMVPPPPLPKAEEWEAKKSTEEIVQEKPTFKKPLAELYTARDVDEENEATVLSTKDGKRGGIGKLFKRKPK